MIVEYPIMHEGVVLCEVEIETKTVNGIELITPESHAVINAAIVVRNAMLRWHNKELRQVCPILRCPDPCPESGQTQPCKPESPQVETDFV